MARSLWPTKTSGGMHSLKHGDAVVVIGLGVASFTFLSMLKLLGFKNVTVITKDRDFGGKCVNYGCMPSEYAFSLSAINPIDRRDQLKKFISGLKNGIESRLIEIGYPIIFTEAMEIRNKNLILKDGEHITFDRLVIGAGSFFKLSTKVSLLTDKLITIENLWSLEPNCQLIIYTKNNLSGISVGAVASKLGLNVTVLLEGRDPLQSLPSFEYYLKKIKQGGVSIHSDIRLRRVDQEGVSFESGAKVDTLFYDYLLVIDKPIPNLLPIDGCLPDISHIDYQTSSFNLRPDIAYVGDSAGLFLASEAECHSEMLIRYLTTGHKIDLEGLGKLPIYFHGNEKLAIVGDPWTYFENRSKWYEVDFNVLGWSAIEKREGKLWFLFNKKEMVIEGIHICHSQSTELVALASTLMKLKITDPVWTQSYVHPSAAEIFKQVAKKAIAACE